MHPSLPASVPALAVLAGDMLVLLAFIAAGIYDHGGDPFALPIHTLEAFAPFFIAWVVISPLSGLYHEKTLTDYRRTLALVVGTWLLVSVGGAAIRSTSYFAGDAPITFILVTIGFGTLFLLGWRLPVVWFVRRSTN